MPTNSSRLADTAEVTRLLEMLDGYPHDYTMMCAVNEHIYNNDLSMVFIAMATEVQLESIVAAINLYNNPFGTNTVVDDDEPEEAGVAPHEGNELELLLSGDKLICTLSRSRNKKLWDKAMVHAARSQFSQDTSQILVSEKVDGDITAFYLKVNEDVAAIHRMLLNNPKLLCRSEDERSVLFGRLFGYSDYQIKQFLEADMKCACGHCLSEEL